MAIFQFQSKNVAWKWSWDQTRLTPNRTNITSCSLMFCFSEICDGVMWTSVGFRISSPWFSVCSSHRWPLVLVSLLMSACFGWHFMLLTFLHFFLWSSLQFLAYSHISLSEDTCRKSDPVTYCLSSQTFLGIWVKASMALYPLRSVNIKQNHRSEVVVYHQFSNRWKNWSQGCCGLRALRDCRLRGKTCVVLCGQSMPNPFSFLKVVF